MPANPRREIPSGDALINEGRVGAFTSGLLVIGQDQVLASTPELVRLFPVLLEARPALGSLPLAIQEIARAAQASGTAGHRREFPLAGRGSLVEITALPLVAGATTRVVLAVTERPAAAPHLDALRRMDRLANLGTLSASMAHEVRNAFVAVKTFIDLLIEQNPDTELASLVRREMSRIDSLVAQMLRFAAPANPDRRLVTLHATLEHTLRMVMPGLKTRAIKLVRDFGAQPDTLAGDDYQLEQAVLNLLLNAVEAMGAEGTLTIATATLAAGDSRAAETKFATQPCLLLSVSDTGPGMPGEARRHLYEPFFTTKPHGTGLGLAITSRIVKEHEGVITLASELGRGCTFTLLFPAWPAG